MLEYLILLLSLLLASNATIYRVATDDNYCDQLNSSIHTLQHYINNANRYFISHTYLYFLPGQHLLNTDFIINSITNFTVAGNQSTIICTPPANIRVVNVTNFTLKNIDLSNCRKENQYYLYAKFLNLARPNNHIPDRPMKCNSSILLDNCTSVVVTNVSINAEVGTTGLFVVNMKNSSTIFNLKIYVNCSGCPQFYSHISGIIFYYYTKLNYTSTKNHRHNSVINLFQYQYKTYGSCPYHFQYAITLLQFQKQCNVSVNIENMKLNNLENSSFLYYSGEISENDIKCTVKIKDSLICNNIGNPQLKMFHIALNNYREIIKDLLHLHNQQQNMIYFENCIFTNNTNMEAMIYLTPGSSRVVSGYIKMKRIIFSNNRQLHFIIVRSKLEILWQFTTYIRLYNVSIFSNKHTDGGSLISVTNGVIYLINRVICTNNSYYRYIIELHMSIVVGKGYITFTNNTARQILQAKSGSYVIISDLTTVDMSANTVYMVAKQARTIGDNTQPICPIQFHSHRGNIDKDHLVVVNFLYKVLMLNNVHMISKNLPGEDVSFGNCTWLAGTAFHNRPAKLVYEQVLRVANFPVNRTTKRVIPLSVCPCTNLTDYNCYSPILGSVFPGQTITIKLLVEKKWLNQDYFSTTLIVANTPEDECSVVDSHQLLQTHLNHGCNDYSYTIWPSNKHRKECKLFLGISQMPEMFYIEMKPCPQGFTLDNNRKACHCDPLLDNKILSITFCDLDHETIQRPANTWISADTVKGTHAYLVSSACPLDYCLPYSLPHKLSDPDSQCQFNRSGTLCGECKQGLSCVFGSSQCKHCSDIYVLLVIPIAICGLGLVVILFTFHLTVTNGIINSFIFYFNIISINHMIVFPGCKSVICTMVMFINLDIGIETCFYNGMDDYASTWLLLVFPTYLVLIAVILIVMSRYSTTIQRITAKKALPVLATIFLLSYTKILRTVCRVLFQYSTLTHLPSNHTKVVWSVSTVTPLFGFKFTILFITCIILFLILLPFNIILLFTRTLYRFKFITYFKPLLDPYFAPYKDKAFYWTGLLLLIRTIILALSGFAKDVSLTAIGILLGGLLWWHGVVKPFRSKYENFQESILLLNLLAVHAIPLYIGEFKLAQILITISVVYFSFVLLYYCFIFRFKNFINSAKFYDAIHKLKAMFAGERKNSSEMQSTMMVLGNNYQEFQEPVVEYD